MKRAATDDIGDENKERKLEIQDSDDKKDVVSLSSAEEEKGDSSSSISMDSSKDIPDVNISKEDSTISCAVCFETYNEGNNMISFHQCPQCVPEAWRICNKCEQSILSRSCPICRGDYAPLAYYSFDEAFSGDIQPISSNLISAVNFAKLSLITYENVAIWNPDEGKLWFSLPKDSSLSPKNIQYMRAYIAIKSEDIKSHFEDNAPIFQFTNKIWDELENSVESEANDANENSGNGDVLNIRETIRWVTEMLTSTFPSESESRISAYPPYLQNKILFTRLNSPEVVDLVNQHLRNT